MSGEADVLRCESCGEPIIPLPGAGVDVEGTADALCFDCHDDE